MDALWETAERYCLDLDVADQVAVARRLAGTPRGAATSRDVRTALEEQGVRAPAGYARDVVARWARIAPPVSLLDVLLQYRLDAIDALSAEYGGKPKREESLRNNLRMYLKGPHHIESRTAKGRTDILIPSMGAVIEVKVWTAPQRYQDGLVELSEYIRTLRPTPTQAFVVVFGDELPLPSIITSRDDAIAETRRLGHLDVPVVVIPFQVVSPSTAAYKARKRGSRGR
jgi:hypothetical protein